MTTKVARTQWVEGVLEQHKHLRQVVSEIQEFVVAPRPKAGEPGSHTWAAELSKRLLRLHDELFRHFRFEEQEDTLEEIFASHPESIGRFQKVLGEHKDMLKDLRQTVSDVLEYSEGKRPEDPRLRSRVTSILSDFQRHEEEENHLIQRLEYRDLGTAD